MGWATSPSVGSGFVRSEQGEPTSDSPVESIPVIDVSEDGTPINVAELMGETPTNETGNGTAPPEILTAEIQGEAEQVLGGKKRRGRQKDPIGEMLKQARFGEMFAVSHTLMYRAINTPERPCPDLTPEEAALVDSATTAYFRHLIDVNPSTGPYVPLIGFLFANGIPILNRAAAIVPAVVPIWKRALNGITGAFGWVMGKFRGENASK